MPRTDQVFEDYKRVVAEFIAHTRPLVGVIDYEADLMCDSWRSSLTSVVGWGSYYSKALFRKPWEEVSKAVHQIVDDYIPIDDIGMLVFIHP
jgi:hypothetical protein